MHQTTKARTYGQNINVKCFRLSERSQYYFIFDGFSSIIIILLTKFTSSRHATRFTGCFIFAVSPGGPAADKPNRFELLASAGPIIDGY